MDYDDCELPEFTRENISTARKEHKCCECDKPIRVGMKYWYFVGKWDRQVSAFKQHIECRDACYQTQIYSHHCVPFGGLREYMWEMHQCYEGWRKEKSEMLVKQRSLLAQGIWASRQKTKDQIAAYNTKHAGRSA